MRMVFEHWLLCVAFCGIECLERIVLTFFENLISYSSYLKFLPPPNLPSPLKVLYFCTFWSEVRDPRNSLYLFHLERKFKFLHNEPQIWNIFLCLGLSCKYVFIKNNLVSVSVAENVYKSLTYLFQDQESRWKDKCSIFLHKTKARESTRDWICRFACWDKTKKNVRVLFDILTRKKASLFWWEVMALGA